MAGLPEITLAGVLAADPERCVTGVEHYVYDLDATESSHSDPPR